jgi:hypothetical protein
MPSRKPAAQKEIAPSEPEEDLDEMDAGDLDVLEADEDDLIEEDDLAEDEDLADADDLAVDLDVAVDETPVEVLTAEPASVERAADEAEEDDDEEPDDEDVEASLDVILKERLVVEDEPEDDEPTDVEDRSEGSERVLPKQPDEFVCRSCFLVKHPSQLADKKKLLCRDCV